MNRTATVVIPDGYVDAFEFAADCGVELVSHDVVGVQTWTITVRRKWRERISFAWALLTAWPVKPESTQEVKT